MTVSLQMPPISRTTPATVAPSPAGAMLLRVVDVLEHTRIPYCILHGYEQYPRHIPGDVDILIPARYLPKRLAETLYAHRGEIGAQVVQWFTDGAHLIVLVGCDENGLPVCLQLHVCSNYEMARRTFLPDEELLINRRRQEGFWTPPADAEFACVLINRVSKLQLTEVHGERLSQLYAIDPHGCEMQASRWLSPEGAHVIIEAAKSGTWHTFKRNLSSLRKELLSRGQTIPVHQKLSRVAAKVSRWVAPRNGFHAVFLGPDGVGKSTTIEAFQRALEPVYLRSIYLTFAPGLLPRKFAPPKPDGPHSLAPRSLPASLLKAAWWLVCYTLGYFATIRPTLARGGLVVNHRYLIDAIVDQKRYRYSGPVWLLKMIWAVAPKPDVVILLDAPPELIQRRKQEVPFEETARQVQAYRRVIGGLPIGQMIDASQPREKVAADVQWLVLDRMAKRIARRFQLGGAL